MMNPFLILVHSARQAWRNYYHTLLISALWLAAQLLIVTGPPATAVLFAMAQNTHEGAYWNAGNLWHAFRELFVPAWIWAMPNILVAAGLALGPVSDWWGRSGVALAGLRVAWVALAALWLGLNLFYWPSWLGAVEPSLRAGYVGSIRFWRQSPIIAFYVFLVTLLVAAVSLPFMLPFVLGVAFWIALVAETAVHHGRREFEQSG